MTYIMSPPYLLIKTSCRQSLVLTIEVISNTERVASKQQLLERTLIIIAKRTLAVMGSLCHFKYLLFSK